tara:strand:+ start:1789 stop:3507 length:1719 start_codon:yes stop_codon:yes gene_type:complete
MKPTVAVLKVENKVKKTVKSADNRIKSFNKFITGKTTDFKKIKIPDPITFFKAKAFIKSLDRLQGAKGSGGGGGGNPMDKLLPIAAGSAIITMGALIFSPNTKAGESQNATDQVLQEQYGGDKNQMRKDLKKEKKQAQKGSDEFKNVADQRKTDIDKTVDNLSKSTSTTGVMGSGGLPKLEEGSDITKKEKLDINKFNKLAEEVRDLVESGTLKRAMGPSFWEWAGDRTKDLVEGTKRVAGGTLDLLTLNIFDFDKKNEPERTVDEDGLPRADGALDEEKFAKIKINYVKEEFLTERPQTTFRPTTQFVPQKEILIASTNLSGMGIEPTGSTFGSTDGGTGRVNNAAGWVHGHFQTNTGTADDLIKDVIPIVEKLIAQDIPTELSGGQKFKKGMSKDEIVELIKMGIQQHGHSGDGRSVDIFVPEGTKVPVSLTDVKAYGGAEGVSGILPGTGHTWVGHLTQDSKSGPHVPDHMDVPNQEVIPPLPPLNSKVLPTVEGMKVPEVYPSYNTKSNVVNNVAYLVQPPSVSGGSGGDRVVISETGGGGVSMMMPSGGAGAGDIVSAFTLHRLGSA